MADAVFDSSALVALLRNEPGAGRIAAELAVGVGYLGTVNLAEAIASLGGHGLPHHAALEAVDALQMEIIPFTRPVAETAAALREPTRTLGLGLGDRACLALASHMGLRVVTTDRTWADLNIGVDVLVAR